MVTFKPGDRVRSITIGRRLAFEGTILGPHPNHLVAYYVRDDDGEVWCRAPHELTLVPADQPRRGD